MQQVTTKGVASQPMAFVSDIHGNLEALDAVLAELDRLEVGSLYVAGDLVFGGESPLVVWQRLQERKAQCTRGPSDAALAYVDPNTLVGLSAEQEARVQLFTRTRSQLGDLVTERLRRLPEKIRVPLVDGRELLLVHGSPADPSQEISHDMDDDEILALLGDDPADIVVCGASHVPFRRSLEGVEIVNVGSVGAAPEGRVAHYAIVTPRLGRADIEQSWVEY